VLWQDAFYSHMDTAAKVRHLLPVSPRRPCEKLRSWMLHKKNIKDRIRDECLSASATRRPSSSTPQASCPPTRSTATPRPSFGAIVRVMIATHDMKTVAKAPACSDCSGRCSPFAGSRSGEELYAPCEITGAIHLYIGGEAIAVGACEALRQDDFVTSTHRSHGHCTPGLRFSARHGGNDAGARRSVPRPAVAP